MSLNRTIVGLKGDRLRQIQDGTGALNRQGVADVLYFLVVLASL
jgi:hypothetical protein